MKHCNPKKDFPNFCPPPAPKPPCMPPAPSVVEGESIYQALNNLSDRVNVCISTYNDVMSECYKTLHNMEEAAQANGSYYGPCEVWTEDGYYAEESATYTLVHKAVVDKHNQPIRVQLYLAYGNTTNSKLAMPMQTASKQNFADKIFIAQPMSENGWYGNAIINGAPIPSASQPTLYTAGFTRSGVLRVYSNSVSTDQMLRDTIEDAMGVSGVLIQNGQIAGASYMETIPSYDKQTARVAIGQNSQTREVIFLVCGNENDVNKKGMTSQAVANVLLQYGCDVAVELCEGSGAGAMDKGSLLFIPENDTIPSAYCYWVISRACSYKNDYQRELAELVQNYGDCIWQNYLNSNRISKVANDLATEINRATAAEGALDQKITEETNRATEAEEALDKKITDETNRATLAESALGVRIDQEISDRESADENLQEQITSNDNDIASLTTRVSTLETDVNALKTQVTVINSTLTSYGGRLDEHDGRLATIQAQVTSMDTTITTIMGNISSIETAVNNIKEQITNIISGTTVLPYLKLSGGTVTGTVDVALANIKSTIGNTGITVSHNNDSSIAGMSPSSFSLASNVTGETGDYMQLTLDSNNKVALSHQSEERQGITSTGVSMKEGTVELFTKGSDTDNRAKLTGVKDPENPYDAANKHYVDASKYSLPAATASSLGGVKVGSGLSVTPDGTLSTTGGSTGGITQEEADARYLKLTGGTMSGSINMGGSTITGLPAPSAPSDAVTKEYVDENGSYTLPAATASTLGGVKVGSGLSVTTDGTLSATGGSAAIITQKYYVTDRTGEGCYSTLAEAISASTSNFSTSITLEKNVTVEESVSYHNLGNLTFYCSSSSPYSISFSQQNYSYSLRFFDCLNISFQNVIFTGNNTANTPFISSGNSTITFTATKFQGGTESAPSYIINANYSKVIFAGALDFTEWNGELNASSSLSQFLFQGGDFSNVTCTFFNSLILKSSATTLPASATYNNCLKNF